MSKVKGICVLLKHSDDANAPVNKLTVGKQYGFEKELINAAIGYGYTVINGADPLKLKQSSFDLYFKEVPAEAQAGNTEKKADTAIKGPSTEKSNAGAEELKPRVLTTGQPVAFDLSSWKSVSDIINFITLTPSPVQKDKIDVLISIKPDINVTLFGTAEEVMMKILPDIKEFVSVKSKVADLQMLIEKKIALEKEAVKLAEEKVKEAKKKPEAAKTTDKASKATDKKPVETSPSQKDMFAGDNNGDGDGDGDGNDGSDDNQSDAGGGDTTDESWT